MTTTYVPIPGRRFVHPSTYCDGVFDIDPADYRDQGRNRQADILADVQISLEPLGLRLTRMVGGYRREVYGRQQPCRQVTEHGRTRHLTTGGRHPLNFVAWTPGGEVVFQKAEGKSNGSGHSYVFAGRTKMNTGDWIALPYEDKRALLNSAADVRRR